MFLHSLSSEYVLLLKHNDAVLLALESHTENMSTLHLIVQCTEFVPVSIEEELISDSGMLT